MRFEKNRFSQEKPLGKRKKGGGGKKIHLDEGVSSGGGGKKSPTARAKGGGGGKAPQRGSFRSTRSGNGKGLSKFWETTFRFSREDKGESVRGERKHRHDGRLKKMLPKSTPPRKKRPNRTRKGGEDGKGGSDKKRGIHGFTTPPTVRKGSPEAVRGKKRSLAQRGVTGGAWLT